MKKLATAVLCALTLTACTPTAPEKHPDPSETPATQSPNPEPSPELSDSPSPEPSPTVESPSPDPMQDLSPEQEAAAGAVLEFFSIYQAVVQDLDADVQPLADITDGEIRRMLMEIVAQYRLEHSYRLGDVKYTILEVDEPIMYEGERQIIVRVCGDGTAIQTIDDRTGKPSEIYIPTAHVRWELVVADRHGLKIVDGYSRGEQSC